MELFAQQPPEPFSFIPLPPTDLPTFVPNGAYACVATIERRVNNLEMTIESVYDQFDAIFVYLNEFENPTPSFLDDPKIYSFRSQDYMDLNATGKVFFAGMITDGYIFTLDDDMLYPANYVEHLRGVIQAFDNRVAACVHGSILPDQPDYYYLRTTMYPTQSPLEHHRFVSLPGSGVFAFKAGTLDVSLDQFLPETMVDLTMAILCKRNRLPIVCVDRPAYWVQNTDREGLFQAFTSKITHHSAYARAESPWGFAEYAPMISELAELAERSGLPVDRDAFESAAVGRVPENWSLTSQYYRRLAEYLASNADDGQGDDSDGGDQSDQGEVMEAFDVDA